MVRVDFTIYQSFSSCPGWWRNFVTCTTKGKTNREVDKLIFDGMLKFNGAMIENGADDVEELVFETEEDFNAFRLYWTLYGS